MNKKKKQNSGQSLTLGKQVYSKRKEILQSQALGVVDGKEIMEMI